MTHRGAYPNERKSDIKKKNRNFPKKETKKLKRGNPRAKNTNVQTTKAKSKVFKSAYNKPKCHSGNNLVFSYGKGGIYAGGWTRDADAFADNINIVIDLTANEYGWLTNKRNAAQSEPTVRSGNSFPSINRSLVDKDWLDLYIQDYAVPWNLDAEFWSNLAEDLKVQLDAGRNALICCTGGHGRTGLVLAILLGLIRPDLVGNDPIKTVRDIYCENCVETREQAEYVYLTLGLSYDELDLNSLNLYGWSANVPENWNDVQYLIDAKYDEIKANDVPASEEIEIEVDGIKETVRRWNWDDGGYTVEYEDGTYEHFTVADELYGEDDLTEEYHAIMRGDVASTVCKTCHGMSYTTNESGSTVICEACDGFGLELSQI